VKIRFAPIDREDPMHWWLFRAIEFDRNFGLSNEAYKEVYDWCAAQFGAPAKRTAGIHDSDKLWWGSFADDTFGFQREDLAMAFKLRWG
jgi:hypothetical protein